MDKIKRIGLLIIVVGGIMAWCTLSIHIMSMIPQAANNYANHIIERARK